MQRYWLKIENGEFRRNQGRSNWMTNFSLLLHKECQTQKVSNFYFSACRQNNKFCFMFILLLLLPFDCLFLAFVDSNASQIWELTKASMLAKVHPRQSFYFFFFARKVTLFFIINCNLCARQQSLMLDLICFKNYALLTGFHLSGFISHCDYFKLPFFLC